MPHSGEAWDLDSYVENHISRGGYWAWFRRYTVSLLKAWWGGHATADNDFAWNYLPHISAGHSAYDTVLDMLDGKVKGYMLLGENPAVGSANSRLHRLALAKLDWLVVRDFVEIESAAFWRAGPEIESG